MKTSDPGNGGSSHVVLEPDKEYFSNLKVVALPTVQNRDSDGLYLAVANFWDQPITLRKGDVIGQLHRMDKVIEIPPLNLGNLTDKIKFCSNSECQSIPTNDGFSELPSCLASDLQNLCTDQKKLVV